ATDLFLGSEEELAVALGIERDAVAGFRKRPGEVPAAVLARLGKVLKERGRGMARVGEMLLEEATN
ncbi:MAG: hypothetical protein GWM90_22050, partial [Gemmatimonadetes bacterium]|nr:hypothetical protein [Gemmatimonadota bacterium]NIQ54218.1 hypothetical protein [Gemmatimonadota bacterium]NIU74423.1 hypothetical protein [Gammaproteobacteria bacterium]NIX46666.1 hypothetical protein [Gemmatimonadota bacterium]